MNALILRILGGTAATAAMLAVSGCGGGSGGATAAQAQPSASGDRRSAFAECLRKNGVTPPTGRPSGAPTARPGGPPSPRPGRGSGGFGTMGPEMQKAFQACASLRPSGGPGAFGGNGGPDNSAMQAFRSCMKDNGAELPADSFRTLKTDDPKIATALKKCRPLLPTGGQGGGQP